MLLFYGNPTSFKALKSVINPRGVFFPQPPKGIDPYLEKQQSLFFNPNAIIEPAYLWNLFNLKHGMNLSDFETGYYYTVVLTVENLSDTLKFVEEILDNVPSVEKVYLLSDQKYDVDEYSLLRALPIQSWEELCRTR